MRKEHIVITGFMGAGKTTVAFELGRLLGCEVVDLDEAVQRREHRQPKEIIEQDGEAVFRNIETRVLREVLQETPAGVIALGGGTWTISENRRLLNEHASFSVWLDIPFESCWKRIEAGEQVRPLAISRDIAKSRYDERLSVYRLVDCRVEIIEEESPEEVARRIAAIILQTEDHS